MKYKIHLRGHIYRVKSVRIRSFFWSVFSPIRTEYGVILRISPCSVRMRKMTNWNMYVLNLLKKSDVVQKILDLNGKLLVNADLHELYQQIAKLTESINEIVA